jgi:3-hydroxyisobutyrate dehydrogenase-like beta-hydroxyacid dehydrogenase
MDEMAIGFVGLGAMGGRMAPRLLARERVVHVYDTNPAALAALVDLGATSCASPLEVADRAGTVLLSLPTPDVVRAVAIGPGGLIEGSAIRTCVDLSTSGPAVAREVGERLAAAGIGLVDAPVSGGVKGAERGALTVMVACAAETLAGVLPLLDELAANVVHVSERPGMGQLVKVLNNLLSATALAATAEAVALGVKSGLDARVLLDAINASSGRNSATAQKFPEAVLTRSFDFGFALALMDKDVQICLAEGRAAGAPMPVGEAVGAAWDDARARSVKDADCTEIVKLVERAAGTVIGSPGDSLGSAAGA